MQYILTEEEYAELKREHSAKAMTTSARMQEICILAALWLRRESGDSACDMYRPIEVVSTFKD